MLTVKKKIGLYCLMSFTLKFKNAFDWFVRFSENLTIFSHLVIISHLVITICVFKNLIIITN